MKNYIRIVELYKLFKHLILMTINLFFIFFTSDIDKKIYFKHCEARF